MNEMISGYSGAAVRSHQERLDAMRAHHPANMFAAEWGKRGSMTREPKAFKEAIARRDDKHMIAPPRDFVAKVQAMRDAVGCPQAAFRLSCSTNTVERILRSGRMRITVYDRIAACVDKPYEKPAAIRVQPPAELVEKVRALVTEEGSYRSAAKRMGVSFSQLVWMLEGKMLSAGTVERIESRVGIKPEGWVRGIDRARVATENRKASFHADSCKRVARALATKQNAAALATITVCPSEIVVQLDALVAEMGAVPAADALQVSYNALRRLRTREPVRRCTVAAVQRSLARRAA